MRHPCATIADGLGVLAAFQEAEQPDKVLAPGGPVTEVDAAHVLGWNGGQAASIAHLRSWVRHLRLVAQNRWPWCDTCGLPAVVNGYFGWSHSTPGQPQGLYPQQDKSGHEVAATTWYDTSSAEIER